MTLSAYQPGICNIGPAEIARRRQAGHIALVATIVLFAVLVAIDAPPLARLVVALPAAASASGYLQAWLKFCAGFASRGIFNFGRLGQTAQVVDADARRRDRTRATRWGWRASRSASPLASWQLSFRSDDQPHSEPVRCGQSLVRNVYTTGTTTSVRSVDVSSPPITTVASSAAMIAPSVRPSDIGTSATIVAAAVISTGRRRIDGLPAAPRPVTCRAGAAAGRNRVRSQPNADCALWIEPYRQSRLRLQRAARHALDAGDARDRFHDLPARASHRVEVLASHRELQLRREGEAMRILARSARSSNARGRAQRTWTRKKTSTTR